MAIVHFYEDEIKQYAVSQLNKNLDADVSVESIDLDLWSKFPYASLRFQNTFIPDLNDSLGGDTLLFAKDLFFKFNLYDLYSGQYKVETVEASKVYLNLEINLKNRPNYIFWKEDSTQQGGNFQFDLTSVSVEDLILNYKHEGQQQDYNIWADQLELTGHFEPGNFALDLRFDGITKKFSSGNLNYLVNRKTNLAIKLAANTADQRYKFTQGDLIIEDMKFSVTGEYAKFLQLDISGNQIQLASVFSIFPSSLFVQIADYKSSGIVAFKANFQTQEQGELAPIISADFQLNDGKLTEPSTNVTLENLKCRGAFTNNGGLGKEQLTLDQLAGNFQDCSFNLSGMIKGFSLAKVAVKGSGKLNLSTLHRFFKFPGVKLIDGEVAFNGDYQLNQKPNGNWRIKKSTGSINFNQVTTSLSATEFNCQGLTGRGKLKNDDFTLKSLDGEINGTKLRASGQFDNLLPYLLSGKQKLIANVKLEADYLDVNKLLSEGGGESTHSQTEGLPKNVDVKLNAKVGELSHDGLVCQHVQGVVRLRERRLQVYNTSFGSFGGAVNVKFDLIEKSSGYNFSANVGLNNVDITQIFIALDNFGQDVITAEHIVGKANTTILLNGKLTSQFELLDETLWAKADLNVADGELLQLPLLQETAQYLGENGFARATLNTPELTSRLRQVQFSELSNQIEIKEGVIRIPEMTINSSVFDLGIEGTHDFSDRINYHVDFRLSDLLMRKTSDEFGEIEDDGLGHRVYLQISGTVNDPQFSIDRKRRNDKRLEEIAMERQNIKEILSDEFGGARNSEVGLSNEEDLILANPEFKVEWEEEKDTVVNEVSQPEQPKKKKKKSRFGRFLDKLEREEKEPQVQVEIDDSEL